MPARAAAKTGLSLTVEPRTERREIPDQADHRHARHVAWGALLVSAAAIGGHLLGPYLSGSESPTGKKIQGVESERMRAPQSFSTQPSPRSFGEF